MIVKTVRMKNQLKKALTDLSSAQLIIELLQKDINISKVCEY